MLGDIAAEVVVSGGGGCGAGISAEAGAGAGTGSVKGQVPERGLGRVRRVGGNRQVCGCGVHVEASACLARPRPCLSLLCSV